MDPIFGSLKQFLKAHQVDFLLHAGDLVEHGTTEEIDRALQLMESLETPSVICLGNHDLARADSWERWRQAMMQYEHLHFADTVIREKEADIFVLNIGYNRTNGLELFWERSPICYEGLTKPQFAWLEEQLQAGDTTRPAILMVHVPPQGLPPQLTGFAESRHDATPSYRNSIHALLDRHPRIKLVLCGHNHVHCAERYGGSVCLSTTSLIESPFELRLIRIQEGNLEIDTLPVISPPADDKFLPEFSWVTGRAEDRQLSLRW